MDARNTSDRTLDLPTLGLYGVAPGETILGKAGQYAPVLDTSVVAGLLHQSDLWSAADDEAKKWLEKNPGPAPAEEPPAQPETDAERLEATEAFTKEHPETVGLVPMPEEPAKKTRRGSTGADTDTPKE